MPKNHRKPADDRVRLAEGRREAITDLLRAQRAVTVGELERQFGISPMTARRDLAELERQGLARRTHGGAVLPSTSGHEDSFTARMGTATAAKRVLASAAAATVEDGEALFLDSSTTAYHLAELLVREDRSVTVVTNSLPIIDLIASNARDTIELIAVGGQLRRISRSFVGPVTVEAVRRHWTDRAFLSVKGIAPNGTLTDADPFEAEVKRTMIEQAESATLLVDGAKLERRGLSVIGPVTACSDVLVAGAGDAVLAAIDMPGVTVRRLGGHDTVENESTA